MARVLKQYAREREINELREKLRAFEEKLKELEGSLSIFQEIVQVDGGPRVAEKKQLQVLQERRVLQLPDLEERN